MRKRKKIAGNRYVDTDTVISIIRMIQANPRSTALVMSRELGVSPSTVARTLKKAREVLGVQIKWIRSPEVDDAGHYEIQDYGILDKKALKDPPL